MRARAVAQEGQLLRIRVDHMQRFEQTLCVSVDGQDALALNFSLQSFEGFRFALQIVDRLRLLSSVVSDKFYSKVLLILSRITSADFVHTNGFGSSL